MDFDGAMREAAKKADVTAKEVMRDYRRRRYVDEDDITPALLGALKNALNGQVGGLTWDASVVRHRRGRAAEEKRIGADILIHVTLDTNVQRYSKGVLVQAKRFEHGEQMSTREQEDLKGQCRKMLAITPAAFVFDYATSGIRCDSATKIEGSLEPELHHSCSWTAYRFFLELFRCPIGDPRIVSAAVSDLPIGNELRLAATGELDREPRSTLRLR